MSTGAEDVLVGFVCGFVLATLLYVIAHWIDL